MFSDALSLSLLEEVSLFLLESLLKSIFALVSKFFLDTSLIPEMQQVQN